MLKNVRCVKENELFSSQYKWDRTFMLNKMKFVRLVWRGASVYSVTVRKLS
jgi:hypothetical protein